MFDVLLGTAEDREKAIFNFAHNVIPSSPAQGASDCTWTSCDQNNFHGTQDTACSNIYQFESGGI